MGIVLFFIDGLGMGSTDPQTNPCMDDSLEALRMHKGSGPEAWNQGRLIPLDACLGVDGLPQSASGQTALFTGVNAPQRIGKHLPAFPNAPLREVLREHSIFKRARDAGYRALFLNAYRPGFFGLPMEVRWRMSTTTVATLAAGLSFYSTDDLPEGKTLYHDFTNEELVRRGFEVPLFSPEEAARVVFDAAAQYDLVVYEHFKTDKAGHSQDRARTLRSLKALDRLIGAVASGIDREETLFMVTSDHGNIEDLSTKGHTRNPVPLLLWGAGAHRAEGRLQAITDVPGFIMDTLAHQNAPEPKG